MKDPFKRISELNPSDQGLWKEGLKHIKNIRMVESFRQKVYIDDSWRKITKSEHIVLNNDGKRVKVLNKIIQCPDGTKKARQKITNL